MSEATATVTPRQIELFHKLTTDREFAAGTNVEKLRADFAKLNKASASAWIDRAMNLPKLTADGTETVTPPTF